MGIGAGAALCGQDERFLWAWLCGAWAEWRFALSIVKPDTVIAWHRQGFRLFWTWKVRRGQAGRPTVPKDDAEFEQFAVNAWSAPHRISKYMVRHRKPPSQTWRTFLDNHLNSLVSVDFFTVRTIRFQILYVFLVLAHARRRVVHFAVTAHPTYFVDQVKAMGIMST